MKLRLRELTFYATLIKFLRNWLPGHKLSSLNGIVQHVVCFEQRSGAINRISVSTQLFPCLLCLISLEIYCISKDKKSLINSGLSISGPMYLLPFSILYYTCKVSACYQIIFRDTNNLNPLTPGWNCARPTPDSLAFFGIFQSERKHKNKLYAQ